MTERLYYADAFLREFTARVTACAAEKDGWAAVLDRTAFYPEGGGQPGDRGTLDGAAVTDTVNRGNEIVHLCAAPLPVGKTVVGRLDWERRFDLMQQHSGEHIVSGMICARYGCDNVGFHIGRELVTIDFDAVIPPEDLPEIESAVNRYIWEDREAQTAVPSPAELEKMEYRSKKELTGEVRIVTWPGADRCACCGVHLRSAGQAGIVKLFSCRKFRRGVRIEMAAGGRALRLLDAAREQDWQISRLLSARPEATAAAVERLLGEAEALRGRIAALEEADFAEKARRLTGTGDVLLFEGDGMAPESVRRLCAAVGERCGGRCAVFAGDNGEYKYAVSIQNGDIRALTGELNAALRGRGGGRDGFAQGHVQASEAEIRAFFAKR